MAQNTGLSATDGEDSCAGGVRVIDSDGIRSIMLDRPKAKNAITLAMAQTIAAALDELDRRDDLLVGVITGSNGTFSSGMDLKRFSSGELPFIADRGFAGFTQSPPEKPLIAAVEGYALAGGFEMALACDVITAGAGARFGLPEVTRGLVAAGGGLLRAAERLPHGVAMELALAGGTIDARRAHEIGLVSRIVAEGRAYRAAVDLAHAIAANGPLAVRISKRVLRDARSWPADQRWSRQEAEFRSIFASEDAREGSLAFAQKRKPRWRGR